MWREGEEPGAPWVVSSHPRHAHLAGFDLHANVAVAAADRARLEQLCRYLRPPVAQDRLQRLDDDYIRLTLKTPWADGTRHLLFAPLELLEKLAALTPRPQINLILYHGVLAPHARWRERVVEYGLPAAAVLTMSLYVVYDLILLRHGATHADQAELDNVGRQRHLTDKGRAQARALVDAVKAAGVAIDVAYSIRFQRAVETARLIAGKEPQTPRPCARSWASGRRRAPTT